MGIGLVILGLIIFCVSYTAKVKLIAITIGLIGYGLIKLGESFGGSYGKTRMR